MEQPHADVVFFHSCQSRLLSSKERRCGQVHAGHGLLVFLGVADKPPTGFDGFFFVHFIRGANLWMGELQGESVKYITNHEL